MNESITVKCPECGHPFSLSEGVLSSVRETISLELQSDISAREEAVKTSKQANEDMERKILEKKLEQDEREEALDLEVGRTLAEERKKIRNDAKEEANEAHRLKDAEHDKVISDLREQIKVLERKSEQGSTQLQGDVLEIDLENRLKQEFPMDKVSPISTGVRGADITQEVFSRTGRSCGTIIYEAKRTKNWSKDWIAKLKGDMREAQADIAMIVTQALPAEVKCFGELDGVWVTDYASAIPLAHVLRTILNEVMLVKGHQEGAKEKQALLYEYLTGNNFRQRVYAVMEAFISMREDLDKEKRAMTKYWNKRATQLNLVMDSMSGMYGDVQALSGGAIEGIASLEFDEPES